MTATTERDLSGYLLVFMAGVLWSTVGLGIRLIEDAAVWQILFYRSLAMSVFLYVVVRLRSGRAPLARIAAMGWPGVIAGTALVAAYTGGIAAIQSTSVANAMMLFAAAPLIAAVLGRIILGESVRPATWIAIAVAACGIAVMVWDKTSGAALRGNLAALGSALVSFSTRSGRAVSPPPNSRFCRCPKWCSGRSGSGCSWASAPNPPRLWAGRSCWRPSRATHSRARGASARRQSHDRLILADAAFSPALSCVRMRYAAVCFVWLCPHRQERKTT
jgi:uncharacterized membrane protein